MKYPILVAATMLAATIPAANALTIDEDERELYDSSIQCMAFFGIMAGLTGDQAEDPAMVESGTKFLAVATVLADDDSAQVNRDFEAEMERFLALADRIDEPDAVQQVQDIDEGCRFMETLVDAMIEQGG